MNKKRLRKTLIGLIVPALLLVIWHIISSSGKSSELIMPKLSSIAAAFRDYAAKGIILSDLGSSFSIVLRGYAVGALAGLTLGILMGIRRNLYDLLAPLFNAVRQIPPLAWIPLLILWMGIGDSAKIVLIGLGVFFPVLLNTIGGIREVSDKYLEFAHNYKVREFDIFRGILLPGAMPSIFVGLRLGASTAWMSIVAAEMIAAVAGVGYRISTARNMMETAVVIAYMVIIGLVGGLMDALLRSLERKSARWKKASK